MKKTILLAFTCCLFLIQFSYAQTAKKKAPQPKVPAVVLEAFNAKYPNTKPEKWDWEPQKETYEADFTANGKKKEATFSPTGKWLKTKTELTKTDLPAPVAKATAAGELASWEMIEVDHIESGEKGIYYKIKFKKGAEEKNLKFDANGNQVNKNEGSGKKTQKS